MTIPDFKVLVANFLNRDLTLFDAPATPPAVDKMLASINMARAWAQRMHKFERCRAQAEVVVTSAGVSLTTAKVPGTQTAIKVRSIDRAFRLSVDGLDQFPIDVVTREQQVKMLQRQTDEMAFVEIKRDSFRSIGGNGMLVQQGQNVSLWPWSVDNPANITIILDVVSFLPELTDLSTADFFLEECLDWLMYRTAFHANFFLKDDQRAPLSAKVIEDAWESVINWDASLIQGSIPID